MAERPLVIYAELSYRPLEYWSQLWARADGSPLPLTTIRTWIRQGRCPAKKIGGTWMISQMELLNWTPPEDADEVSPVEPAKDSKKDGKGEGGRDVRKKDRRVVSPRQGDGREATRWPI